MIFIRPGTGLGELVFIRRCRSRVVVMCPKRASWKEILEGETAAFAGPDGFLIEVGPNQTGELLFPAHQSFVILPFEGSKKREPHG